MRNPRAKGIFAAEFAAEPLWWQDAPPDAANRPPLPARVDVAVIGGGYCGLGAALELARAGAGVAVLDIGALGEGASTRNGGMVGGAVKLDWSRLAARFGAPTAAALLDGARASFEHLENLIAREGFDADYRRCGRFMLACNRAHYRALQREVDGLGERASSVQVVPRERQRQQIGSDFYHGGVVVEESGGLHPAKLHRALRAAAKTAGAELHAHAEVQHLEPAGDGMALVTARGRIRAGQVVVATNGYTGALLPGLRRRVVPVSSYIIVTEPLPPELPERLSPRGRMFVDSNRLLSYFRLSPDGRRVVFGGRLQLRTVDERTAALGLYRRMVRVWPELRGYRITHAWKGYLGFTFDRLPHMGVGEGVHFALGCNGSGVAMASYLGHQVALKILGRQNRPCPFEQLPFPTHVAYRGRAWFLPALGLWYRILDEFDGWRPGR
ncbi:MAG TPA: FAD-binding oxidoreductase [Geminicoccaceae bacterium]|nr:FAD-binding oxidoreductase [Geminicoccaceae bacterium]